MDPLTIGLIAAGTGVLGGVGGYFAGQQPKRGQIGGDTLKPYQGFLNTTPGFDINARTMAALNEGVGVGYNPEFIQRSTSPLVESREARFREEEVPFISGQLSGRGLGRSTIGSQQLGKAATTKERDINEIMGQAYLLQEQQKKQDIGRYEGMLFNIAQQEVAQRNQASGFDLGIKQFDIGQRDATNLAASQNQMAALGTGLNVFEGLSPSGGDLLGFAKQAKASKSSGFTTPQYDPNANFEAFSKQTPGWT